jgi:hypothetical protein
MSDYGQLAAQFNAVRRAWKRAAALAGLAVVFMEGIGILTVLLFFDWLYRPQPVARLGLWTLAMAGLAYFVVRHVIAPLLRKIPDEQVALYIEEHRAELDGVMITAAEFGAKRDRTPGQAELIDAVVDQATARGAKTALNRVVDFSRLRKYGVGAVVGALAYLMASYFFPDSFGHHVGRVLNPWRSTVEDMANLPPVEVIKPPIRFTLDKGDTSLQRGTSFELEVALSRPADKPVVLNFRPRGEGALWQKLPLTEIEKLNGFKGTLADVSEDLEFFVACGADQSETHRLTVYDPLVVQSMEVTTHYPDYVKMADRVERPSNGDVAALIGSKVTVRIMANAALKDCQIKWDNGKTQQLTLDPETNAAVLATFEVKEDATYNYELADVNGQHVTSVAAMSVKALPDKPPMIEVKAPSSPTLTHRVGEIEFQVETTDDYGVESAELVYSRLDAQGKPQEFRAPLKLAAGESGAAAQSRPGTYRLMLEDAKPPLKPEEAIMYHLEARDAKGQKANSDIGIVIVGFFENWATWGLERPPHQGPEEEEGPDLIALLSLTWTLEGQRPHLAPAELKPKSKEIADQMVEQGGQVRNFVNLKKMPQLAPVADQINAHAKNAHEALVKADTTLASVELSTAVAIYAGNGILEDLVLAKQAEQTQGSPSAKPPALTMLEQARLDALAEAAKEKSRQEKEQADAKAEAAANKDIEKLIERQEQVIAKAKNQSDAQPKPDGSAPQAPKPDSSAAAPQPKPDDSAAPKPDNTAAPKPDASATTKPDNAAAKEAKPDSSAAKEAKSDSSAAKGAKPESLADEQRDVADKAKAAADKVKADTAAGSKLQQAADKTAEASRTMHEAAKDFAEGKDREAEAKATKAKNDLETARDMLRDTSREKLEVAISSAETRAAALLDKQRELRGETEAAAKQMGNKAPDQRRQRDLMKQAFKQTGLRSETEELLAEIKSLSQRAEQTGQEETTRALSEAQRTAKRGQPEVKMANAVVELTNAKPEPAAGEQKKAEESLEKILGNLRAGADALAANRDAQLRRAARAAEEVKKGTEQLAKADKEKDPKAGAEPEKKPGKDDKADPKTDKKSGKDDKTQQAKAGEKPKTESPADAKARQDTAQKLAYDVQRLANSLDNRNLVPQADVDRLKQMTRDTATFRTQINQDKKKVKDLSEIAARISNKLEAEMQAKTEANKLFASQREECPPNYRLLVNKYFEALSEVGKQPGGNK